MPSHYFAAVKEILGCYGKVSGNRIAFGYGVDCHVREILRRICATYINFVCISPSSAKFFSCLLLHPLTLRLSIS
jgi:hypothetical protein